MVSKKWLKVVKRLHQKKYRNEESLFFVEGIKTVKELLATQLPLEKLLVTQEHRDAFNTYEFDIISKEDLAKISALRTPPGVLAVFRMPFKTEVEEKGWIVALDDVRDPGNLGTIIRLCDWFGVTQLVCSQATVDCYNPKVLQATMGSIARIAITYLDLPNFLSQTKATVYGAFMEGDVVYQKELPASGVLVMGNEANGVSESVAKHISQKISIPQFGKATAESLNVATATAILLNEIRRG
ncbi:RNA methyltransferase [Flavobacterium sp. ASW18X]|uniref:TrmH family RNA methyltransferase n=1 Tax=Flavobacterium sp. ASW18X TaxID=2572595 RepID=UPI0010ADEA4E|nr:RNA methyltransferase [Flavobacterium sp. ASW18X]TKD59188.1 RNA methyltransferase [Flavobacterium sp. ASW18X]